MDFKNFSDKGAPYTNIKRRVTFRGVTTGSFAAAVVGQILALDTTLASADTTAGYQPTPGTSTGNSVTATTGVGGATLQPIDLMWSSAVEPKGESDTAGQVYCLVTDLLDGAGAANTEIEVLIQGRSTNCKVASDAYTPGQLLMMSATETTRELIAFAAGTTNGQRAIAMVEIGGAAITSATVFFFGWGGLLSSQATTN